MERDSAGKSIPSLTINGNVLTEDGKRAEALNIHFVSADPKLLENITSKQSDNPFKYIKSNDSTFVLRPVTRSQVLMCLSAGQDDVDCKNASRKGFRSLPFAIWAP